MKSYFGYIRVSTPRQGRGVSLDEQRSAILTFSEKRDFKIVEWFVEMETAAKQGRTEYTKMIRALESGKAAGVVIHKIDRGARNMKDWANLGELIDAGVDVQFAHESLDLRSRGGRLAADIQAVVAADYIRNLRDEVLKGFYGRLKQGVYPLPAPVGYLDRGAGIPKEIDPMAGPLVRYAFERYAVGDIGLQALQQELFDRGLKTNRGASLSITGLAGMLHNPFYTGIIRLVKRGESFQGAHTPLIPTALFDRVQNVMLGKHTPKAKSHDFRYRTMISHVGCTRRLTGEIHKGRFVYYRCHGRRCKGVAVPERVIDKAIAEKVLPVACTPEDMRDLRDLMEDERTRQSADTTKDKTSLRMLIVKCDDRLARLTDLLLDSVISKEVFDQRNARLLGERSGLQDQLTTLGDVAVWLKQYREFELKNTQLLCYETLIDDEKRDLVFSLCSNFGLEEKEPVITLRFPYKEIAETHGVHLGGPGKGDVRTRPQRILDILTSQDYEPSAGTSPKSLKSTRQPEDESRAA
jgi:site-specific DNA recombinase